MTYRIRAMTPYSTKESPLVELGECLDLFAKASQVLVEADDEECILFILDERDQVIDMFTLEHERLNHELTITAHFGFDCF